MWLYCVSQVQLKAAVLGRRVIPQEARPQPSFAYNRHPYKSVGLRKGVNNNGSEVLRVEAVAKFSF